jgi:hypothetical protein
MCHMRRRIHVSYVVHALGHVVMLQTEAPAADAVLVGLFHSISRSLSQY